MKSKVKVQVQVQNVECFVAGIIKGLKEHGDISRYFGSTLALGWYCNDAKEHGFISLDGDKIRTAKLTELGEAAYNAWGLESMPECRSYLWPRTKFDLNEVTLRSKG